MELSGLTEEIDHLVESDPSTFGDAESLEALQRQLTRLDALVATAAASFDTSGAWALDGARNAASWIAVRCRIPIVQARRLVRRGREIRRLPFCGQAWSEGDINSAHVDALAVLRSDTTESALARDEAMLVEQARTLRFESFVRAAAYWKQLADPDGTEEESKRRDQRDVYLEASFRGMWFGKMTLDPVSGAIVSDELSRLEQELFEADWAQTRTRVGLEPNLIDLGRTPGQRRADALVKMATRSKTAPADGRRPTPLFSVLVDFETLSGRICELARSTVVSPGQLVPWLDEATIERAVFKPGRRVEVSATSRLFTGATRRAIELRDRACTHPFCVESKARCEVDHVVPYAIGGLTTQENGRLLCSFHNRLRNQRPPPAG